MEYGQYMELLVISSYPQKGEKHGAATVGVASYAKNTIIAIIRESRIKNYELRITVLAERLNNQKEEEYVEDGIIVKRVWKRSSIFLYFSLLKNILSSSSKNILIEFELSMFSGNPIFLLPFPLFILIIRVLNKRVIIVFHQVISDIRDFEGYLGMPTEGSKAFVYNFLLKIFYKFILLFCSKAIVFEEYLKEELSKFGNKKKIAVIPHGVENINNFKFEILNFKSNSNEKKINVKNITKNDARSILKIKRDEFVLLCFGFIAGYKGMEWIINKIKDQRSKIKNRNIKLIIAGGENPNHKNNKKYMDYVKRVRREADNSDNRIVVTGFVPEEKIHLYFKACDIAVFPYKTMMSSSGPLSMAFSFEKPFIVSEKMEKIFETKDVQELLVKSKLKKEDLMFSLTPGVGSGFLTQTPGVRNLREVLKPFGLAQDGQVQNDKILKEIAILSKNIARARSFELIGKMYLDLLKHKT